MARCSRRWKACTPSIRICSNRSTETPPGSRAPAPLLEVCFQQQYRGRKRRVRLSPTAQALTVLILLALGTWMFSAFRARSRWNTYVAALRSEPGIVVVSSGREGGQFVVSGLRDPLARTPRRCWPRTASPPMTLPGAGELYQALHPTLVIARARQLLAPPAEVNLQLQKDVLVASGTAPIDWIDTSLRIAPVIPG